MSRYIDAEKLKCSIDSETDSIFDWDMTIEELYYNLCKLIDDEPTADVQEVKHGYWKFHEKTKLVPANKVGIKEEYTNGHDCTVVDNTNVNKKIMIMKKRITLKIPICSVCGWCGHDECDATPYCPNCGARMDSDSSIADIINEQPTADVQEARHGKWESTELMYENGCTRCSECKTEYYASDLEEICGDTFPTYCPLCGARMDGDSL